MITLMFLPAEGYALALDGLQSNHLLPECAECSGHGNCLPSGLCSCSVCRICLPQTHCHLMIHNCHSAQVGWSGTACTIDTCPQHCNGHGVCLVGRCACSDGYAGAPTPSCFCFHAHLPPPRPPTGRRPSPMRPPVPLPPPNPLPPPAGTPSPARHCLRGSHTGSVPSSQARHAKTTPVRHGPKGRMKTMEAVAHRTACFCVGNASATRAGTAQDARRTLVTCTALGMASADWDSVTAILSGTDKDASSGGALG